MRILKRVMIGVAALLVLAAGVGLFLPSKVSVERSIEIEAPAATLFALVNGFTHFNRYSPWAELDPRAEYRLGGPRFGVGASLHWQSDKPDVGNGKQEIIESVPYEQVVTALQFEGMSPARSTFLLRPGSERTRVTWQFSTDLGNNIAMRWLGLLFDPMIGGDYERGLEKLKRVAESYPAIDIATLDVSDIVLMPRPLLLARGESTLDGDAMQAAMRAAWTSLDAWLADTEAIRGEPVIVTRDWNEADNRWVFDAGYILSGNVPPVEGDDFTLTQSWQGDALRSILRGADYATSAETYEKISLYMALHGYESAGDSWEAYRSEPLETPSDQLVTEIFFPVKRAALASSR